MSDERWGTSTDEQSVFFHCRERAEEVSVFCRGMSNPNIKRIPQKIEIPEDRPWQIQLKLSLPQVPTPYTKDTEEEFWEDVDALISASLANFQKPAGPPEAGVDFDVEASRLPAILVTDSKDLCIGLGDVWIRSLLAGAVGLQMGDILPVILWSTFKLLCGGLVVKAPREWYRPFRSLRVEDGPTETSTESEVQIGLGVYIQKIQNCVEPIDPSFGTRMFVLFSDGFCTYVAIAPDGLKGVSAHGEWDCINGSLVLGCAPGDPLPSFLNATEFLRPGLSTQRYEEPIHIRLEDVPRLFEAPLPLGDCMPRFSKDIRASLLEASWLHQYDALCKRAAFNASARHKPGPRSTGLLKPGKYSFMKKESDKISFGEHTINITLHVAGEFYYSEASMGGVISVADRRSTVWFVQNGTLILTGKRQEGTRLFPMLFQKFCNSRTFEEKLGRVEIPLWIMHERFEFQPFEETLDPFLGYVAVPAENLMQGIVHPKSAAVMTPPLPNDKIPMKQLEVELGLQSIKVDEFISDLSCIDADVDGHISKKEIIALDSYGKVKDVASLADLEELREGLLMTFGILQDAFCALAGDVTGKLTQVEFEKQLRDLAQQELKDGDTGRLRDWVAEASIQEIHDVFNALDTEKTGFLDWQDFSTLHYHGSRHFLSLIDHFRGYLKDFFEGSQDQCITTAFMTLSMGSSQQISKADFLKACVQKIHYPHNNAAEATFDFLDRNLNGYINKADFEYLKKFDVKSFLNGLAELNFAIKAKFENIDNFFTRVLEEEKRVTGKKDTEAVSFKTFERICLKYRIHSRVDLKQMFLFLDKITGAQASGYLSYKEYRLLKGFESRAVVGVPARLRKLLVTKFGSLEVAFQDLYDAWLPKELRGRVEALALRQIVSNCGFVEKTKKSIATLRATLKLGNIGKLSGMRNSQSAGALPFSQASPHQKKNARRRPYIPPDGPFIAPKWEPSMPDDFIHHLRPRPPHFKEGFPNNMSFPGGRPATMSAIDWEVVAPSLHAGAVQPRKQIPWTTL